MNGLPKFVWVESSGHNRDGDNFKIELLVDPDGRVLARVDYPQAGEPTYSCDVYVGSSPSREYISLGSGKQWCEEATSRQLSRERRFSKPRKSKSVISVPFITAGADDADL